MVTHYKESWKGVDLTMTTVDESILDLIKGCRVATVSCAEQNKPYAFNCFYAFRPDAMVLLFKSSGQSRHVSILANNPFVSGTILYDNATPFNNKGLQFEGVVIDIDHREYHQLYYLLYPFAIAIAGKIIAIQLNSVRSTCSHAGIRTKVNWMRSGS